MASADLTVIAVLVLLAIAGICITIFPVLFGNEGNDVGRENDPSLNTRDWQLHQRRLQKFRQSKFRGTYYYVGPRGGVYYINSNGRKVYS